MSTAVDVEAGRIVLRPSLADLFACKFPGATWDSARQAYLLPATTTIASAIRQRVRHLAESDSFKLLIGGAPVAVAQPLGTSETKLTERATAGEGNQSIRAAEQANSVESNQDAGATERAIPGEGSQEFRALEQANGGERNHITGAAERAKASESNQSARAAERAIDGESNQMKRAAEAAITLPAGLLPGTKPWAHQRAAFRFCLDHFAEHLNGLLLAMGMGTGKTLVAIMLQLHLKARRTLIACPLRVVPVWISEFAKHAKTDLVIVGLDESVGSVAEKKRLAAEKLKLAEARGVPFIAVCNYDSIWREPFAEWAEKHRWDIVLLDEGHRIKKPSGKASVFFKRLRKMAAYRFGLTGTPMPHSPLDIYGLMRAIDISIFGPSFSAFRQKYAVMGGFQRKEIVGYQRLDELTRAMGRVTFQVGGEVLDLPPETDVTYHCDLSAEARRIYNDLEEDFVALLKEGVITAANAMVKLLRLQQVANGIVKTDDGEEHRVDEAKLKLLADTLEDIGPDEPVVVFCWYRQDLEAVHLACERLRSTELSKTNRLGYSSCELSGRKDELKNWQDGKAQVIAVQTQSGGEGVDFTRARYSLFYSVSYSLGKYMQARKRTHRPGQKHPVTHVHLITRNTVDVRIMRALEKRAEVVESILAELKN